MNSKSSETAIGSLPSQIFGVPAGVNDSGAHQVRQKVTGGTAGPIISPMTRKSQFRSMPAALKMQDRAPVQW